MNKEQPAWMPTEADHEVLHTECEEWVSMRYHQEAARQTARNLVEHIEKDLAREEKSYGFRGLWIDESFWQQLRQQVGLSPESEER